jgi:hypothetical protein
MNSLINITLCESIYLFYMFFLYKTKYSFNYAIFDRQVQSMGDFFIHNNGNKICMFGKCMAILAIILAWIRVYYINKNFYKYTIIFDLICITLAFLMNMNSFIYIIPLIFTELYILREISKLH